MVYCNLVQADMELRQKKFDLAKVKFQECLNSIWGADNQTISFGLERLADINVWPTSEWQSRWPVIYCAYAYNTKDKLALHKALLSLGDVFIANKDGETAANLYKTALEGFTHMDIHHSRANCMMRLGDLAAGQRCTSKAISLWETARQLFVRSSQAKDIARIDARLSTVEKDHQEALLELGILNAPGPEQSLNTETSVKGVEGVHLESVLSVSMPY
jgi:tetratricopeptide (TPR) repeat protein